MRLRVRSHMLTVHLQHLRVGFMGTRYLRDSYPRLTDERRDHQLRPFEFEEQIHD